MEKLLGNIKIAADSAGWAVLHWPCYTTGIKILNISHLGNYFASQVDMHYATDQYFHFSGNMARGSCMVNIYLYSFYPSLMCIHTDCEIAVYFLFTFHIYKAE